MRLPTNLRSFTQTPLLSLACLFCLLDRADSQLPRYQEPPDISGLAWVEGDTFLAVHDAKNPDENDRPRISFLQLPKSLDGLTWTHVALNWPSPLGLSGDLESTARIPGTNYFLLVESGEGTEAGQRFHRVFMIEVTNTKAELVSFTELPDIFKNIEGSAVARAGDRLIFICAERADDQSRSEVYWTDLELRPLRLGKFNKSYFRPSGFAGKNMRPVSAIEVDGSGNIYIASAYDPNDDNGPFTSVVWQAGRLSSDRNDRIRLVFASKPRRLATLDGFKVESLAIREVKARAVELFAGTDDENYGGAVRPIRLPVP